MNDFIEIKNMVCPKCNEWITISLNEFGIPFIGCCPVCWDELTFSDIHNDKKEVVLNEDYKQVSEKVIIDGQYSVNDYGDTMETSSCICEDCGKYNEYYLDECGIPQQSYCSYCGSDLDNY